MDNKKKDPLAWEEVSVEHVVSDEWIDFRRVAYRLPDGSVFEPYYTYSRKDFVVIVPTDEEGNYLCVKQFRQGVRQVTCEFPAGGIEQKDKKEYVSGYDNDKPHDPAEGALDAAKRELLEETGYESDEWRHLLTIPANATIADNYAHIYEAKNCRKVTGQALDETEFLNVFKVSPDELETMIKDGDFQQVIHLTGLLLSMRKEK